MGSRKEKDRLTSKDRKFCALLYPDAEDYDCEQALNNLRAAFPRWAFCLHDKDTTDDERIEKAIIENNARLVIIDPIQAYLGADVEKLAAQLTVQQRPLAEFRLQFLSGEIPGVLPEQTGEWTKQDDEP